MRQRLLLVALGITVAFSLVLALYNQGRVVSPPPARERRTPHLGGSTSSSKPGTSEKARDVVVGRNPFEYGSSGPARSAFPTRPLRPMPDARPATPAPAPEIHLVGILHPPEGPRAALAFQGEVVVLGPGGTIDGYTVLDISEEGTVRVRTPRGEETDLMAASSSP